ncbi:MAG: CoA transferase [Acidobacteria bacterium]|nr:CoA transferase [Acidobacteriota bacterium]
MGVLDGIKILELARVAPGEFCTMLLADMGAEVLKIETPPADGSTETEEEKRRSAFAFVNRNKRSLALNLKAPEGQAIFQKLASTADVIVEGFRPGVTKRLGADWETIRKTNPRIIYCSLSGFGQDGPYRDYPAHDLNYLSLAGVLGLIGEPDRKPAIPLNLIADYGGASLHGALGILLALFARERSGKGQRVDVAYLDATLSLLAATPTLRFFFSDGSVPRRGAGFLSGSYPYYAVYETRDRKLLSIACTEPWLWENFCKAIGRPEFVQYGRLTDQFVRTANAEEIKARAEIEAIIRTRTRDEWYDFLVQQDACVGKVYDVEEVFEDPQILARQMVVETEHPEFGRVKEVGVAIKMSETPGTVRGAAPYRGEHTDEVLRELGMKQQEIQTLRDKRVVA